MPRNVVTADQYLEACRMVKDTDWHWRRTYGRDDSTLAALWAIVDYLQPTDVNDNLPESECGMDPASGV